MTDTERLNECLGGFSDRQVTTVAELLMTDCLLQSVWQDTVYRFINENCWVDGRLRRAIVVRVEEVASELTDAAALYAPTAVHEPEEDDDE